MCNALSYTGQVGRNLMDHPVQLSWALTNQPPYPYRGSLSTSGIENLRDGAFRSDRGAYRIEIGNDGWNWPKGAPISTVTDLLGKGLRGAELDQSLAHHASRHVRIAALLEQLPSPDNRVTLDKGRADVYGVPLPRINYRIDDYVMQGNAQAKRDLAEIFEQVDSSVFPTGGTGNPTLTITALSLRAAQAIDASLLA